MYEVRFVYQCVFTVIAAENSLSHGYAVPAPSRGSHEKALLFRLKDTDL